MSFTWHHYQTRRWRGKHLSKHEADLLFRLVVSRSPVSRPELIEFLWPDPDLEPETAANMVAVYVHHLREKFGHNFIHNSFEWGYSIPPQALESS